MDINDIEKNLNNFEGDPEKIASAALNSLAIIQATTQTLFDIQIAFYALQVPKEDAGEFVNKAYADLQQRINEVQAEISAKI